MSRTCKIRGDRKAYVFAQIANQRQCLLALDSSHTGSLDLRVQKSAMILDDRLAIRINFHFPRSVLLNRSNSEMAGSKQTSSS